MVRNSVPLRMATRTVVMAVNLGTVHGVSEAGTNDNLNDAVNIDDVAQWVGADPRVITDTASAPFICFAAADAVYANQSIDKNVNNANDAECSAKNNNIHSALERNEIKTGQFSVSLRLDYKNERGQYSWHKCGCSA